MAMIELHAIKLPEALVAKLNDVAKEEHKSVDDAVQEALGAHLRDRDWNAMIGEARARTERLGIPEEDVERIIAESRRDFAQRGR